MEIETYLVTRKTTVFDAGNSVIVSQVSRYGKREGFVEICLELLACLKAF